jgi:hypothetical protein
LNSGIREMKGLTASNWKLYGVDESGRVMPCPSTAFAVQGTITGYEILKAFGNMLHKK